MLRKATFACGCFWCSEAIFKRLKGVEKVVSGYSGGETKNPTYQDVSRGVTGHAEAIQVTFDPKVISYKDLVYVFFRTHDPTTPNQQGPDVGSQYRSVIFYHTEDQKKIAQAELSQTQKSNKDKIVTEIVAFNNFFPAEDYHLDYYAKNPNAMYCKIVIDPKIQKLESDFEKYLD